jgi:hypothetical protein
MRNQAAVASVVAVLLAACGGGPGRGQDDDTAGTGTTAAAGFDALATPEQVPRLAYEKFGEVLKVRRITLTRAGFTLEVRDATKPDNLDTWRYNEGAWTSRPVSVTVREIEALGATTFGLGAVNWKAVPGLMQQALDGLDLEGEEITAVSYDRLEGRAPRVYIGVSGLRGSGSLLADADGTDVEVRRN